MTLPPLFPFQPDGQSNPHLSYEFLTDVMISSRDKEIRQALRETPLRRYSYGISLENAAAVADFRQVWYSPTQMLRYLVPIWSEGHLITNIASDLISGDFSLTEIKNGDLALVYDREGHAEVVTVTDVSDSVITLEDPVVGTYPIGLAKIAPIMVGWITPPTFESQSAESDRLDVAFIEEFQGIAGIDTTLTEKVAAVPAHIVLYFLEYIQPYLPQFVIAGAWVFDENWAKLPGIQITWTAITEASVPVVVQPSIDTQTCRVDVPDSTFVTATVGSLSDTKEFISF